MARLLGRTSRLESSPQVVKCYETPFPTPKSRVESHRSPLRNTSQQNPTHRSKCRGFYKCDRGRGARADSIKVDEIMRRVTDEEPKMWRPSIIGYGLRHLKYESGREMDWMVIGFSPRKGNITFYVGLG